MFVHTINQVHIWLWIAQQIPSSDNYPRSELITNTQVIVSNWQKRNGSSAELIEYCENNLMLSDPSVRLAYDALRNKYHQRPAAADYRFG